MNLRLRIVHGAAVTALVLASWAGFAVVGFSIVVMNFEGRATEAEVYRAWFPVLVGAGLTTFGLGICAIALKARWRWLALAGVPVCALFGFLTHDDPAPPALADLGPRVGYDDPGYQTIMWLSDKSEHSRLKEPGGLDWNDAKTFLPGKTDGWAEHVSINRPSIEEAWANDFLGRAWVDALNAHPPGGVWPCMVRDPIINFKVIRKIVGVRLSKAMVLAHDGKCDEAVQLIIPLLKATQDLQRTSPGFLHGMIATLIIKPCYSAVRSINGLGALSSASRETLLATLNTAPSYSQQCRNLFLGEQASIKSIFSSLDMPLKNVGSEIEGGRWLDLWLRFGGRWLVLTPNRSERQVTWKLQSVCAMAEARDLEKIEASIKDWDHDSPFKNPAGRLLSRMIMPDYTKLPKALMEVDVQRTALIALLETK